MIKIGIFIKKMILIGIMPRKLSDEELKAKLPNTVKFCKCNCGEQILIKNHHRWCGVPDFIHGHNNYKLKEPKKCPICASIFYSKQKTCSHSCGQKLKWLVHPDLFCAIIGFWKGRKKSEEHINKIRMGNLGKKRSEENRAKCKARRTPIEVRLKQSRVRRALNIVGEKNSAWKGGITPIVKKIRHSCEYIDWRSSIFRRDNYSCIFCGKRGGYIVVDHFPKTFAEIIFQYKIKNMEDALACDELWDINNGRTLCKKCHNLSHRKEGRNSVGAEEKDSVISSSDM